MRAVRRVLVLILCALIASIVARADDQFRLRLRSRLDSTSSSAIYGPTAVACPAGSVLITVGDYMTQYAQITINSQPVGTVFCFRNGVHRLQKITPRTGDQYWGENGTAILSGAKVLTGWTQNGSDWQVTGQTQDNPEGGVGECKSAYPMCYRPEDLWINGVLQTHVATRAAMTPGTWFFDYASDVIYVRNNPTGSTVETSAIDNAFVGGSANNVTIKNLIIERYANRPQTGAIDARARDGWVVDDNEIRYNHGVGVYYSNNATVSDNYIHHNYQLGIGGVGTGTVLIDHNNIEANNLQFQQGWEGGGTKSVFSTGVIYRNNWSHHNIGPGLWTDIDNINCMFEGNLVEFNVDAGLIHEIGYDCVIRNNTVRNNGTGPSQYFHGGANIVISASGGVGSGIVDVYGNDITCSGGNLAGSDGFYLQQQARGSGLYGPYLVRRVRFHGNNITMLAGCKHGGWEDVIGNDLFTIVGDNQFYGNNYNLQQADVSPFDWNNVYNTESQFQAAGQESGSTFTR